MILAWASPFNNNNMLMGHPFSSHLHPLQVENCDSNSRLVNENDNGKFRLERVGTITTVTDDQGDNNTAEPKVNRYALSDP